MTRKFFLIHVIYISISLLFFGCNNTRNSLLSTIKFEKGKYFDQTEITVDSWLSYYTWTLENEGLVSASKVLPDSNEIEIEVWNYIKYPTTLYNNLKATHSFMPIGYFRGNCPDASTYFQGRIISNEYCQFGQFPITGISYEQVLNFCKWRTLVQGNNKITYRLPTESEFKTYAKNNLSNKNKSIGLPDSVINNCPTFNYKIIYNKNRICNGFALHESKQWGVAFGGHIDLGYDIFGNISEMTNIKGISKGGNYIKTTAKECHLDSIQIYHKPERWLGFRCIAIKNK